MTESNKQQAYAQWDSELRRRVHQAVDDLLYTCKDVLMRYSDEDYMYVLPGDLEQFGDVTGLIAVARNQVVQRIQQQLKATQLEIQAVYDEIESDKRERIPNYRTTWQPPREEDE